MRISIAIVGRIVVAVTLSLAGAGCLPPDAGAPSQYTDTQRDAVVGECEAESMWSMGEKGTATPGDWRVYSKRNAERWSRVREGLGVK